MHLAGALGYRGECLTTGLYGIRLGKSARGLPARGASQQVARAAASTVTRERSTGSAKLSGTAAEKVLEPPGNNLTALDQERVASSSRASTSGSLVAGDVRTGKVEELISSGDPALSAERIASVFSFPLDAFQLEAVQKFVGGHSVVVCAPTGAGKTAIAEAATIAVLARGQRVIYTTPLKALSNQKLFEMRQQFGHERVGLQTGDASLNAEGQVVVMTTEVLRNIMYHVDASSPTDEAPKSDRLADVGLIVLDEVHYLGDPDRGSVWEEVIINCPQRIPLLCMSATVANPHDLGGWISQVHGSCKTVTTNFRPVPLSFMFVRNTEGQTEMVPLLTKKGRLNPELVERSTQELLEEAGWGDARKANRSRLLKRLEAGQGEEGWRRVPSIEEALEQLQQADLLPAIWFTFSRTGCDNAAMRLHAQGVRLANVQQRNIISRALAELREDQPEAIREPLVPALLTGVASHHAGCLPAWKSLVERLFQQGVIKVVFATGTLAAGINMPARSTVITSITRRISQGSFQQLPHNELLQMAGRAGRRGFDIQGHCVVLQDRYEEAAATAAILARGAEALQSHFSTGYGMVLKLLHTRTLEASRTFIERSFNNYLANEGTKRRQGEIAEAENEAERLLKEAAAAETAAGGAQEAFAKYLELKAQLTEAKKEMRKSQRAAAAARGQQTADRLESLELPVLVGLDVTSTDADSGSMLPTLVVASATKSPDFKFQEGCTYVGLTADNRLMQFCSNHLAAVSTGAAVTWAESDLDAILGAAQAAKKWTQVRRFATSAIGTGRTAVMATKLRGGDLKPIDLGVEMDAVLEEAMDHVVSIRRSARQAQAQAQKAKATRADLQLRAKATTLKRQAKEMRAVLEANAFRANSSMRSFESTVQVLVKAGALEAGSLKATALGEVAREISSENELWLALVLTHPATQTLRAPELAGVVCAMVAGESLSRPQITAAYETSTPVLMAVEAMEATREDLFQLQNDAGISASLIVDLRLAGVVEAWAAGASWTQIMADCNLDGGDVARLLSRTADLLRQAGHCSALLSPLRAAARQAAHAMSRKPITELIT